MSESGLLQDLHELVMTSALSGYEERMADHMSRSLSRYADEVKRDRMGNVVARFDGTQAGYPKIMAFAHMDQLGFVVRSIGADGFIGLERVGGVPEKAMPGVRVRIETAERKFVDGVIGVKSHHVTSQEEKYKVSPYLQLYVDIGADSAETVRQAGVEVGDPVVYEPQFGTLLGGRVSATSIDNRGGCAILLELVRRLAGQRPKATVYIAATVQEEFNLRGAVIAARSIRPDFALCVDIAIAGDTPDLQGRSDVVLGGGPVLGMYHFHGRGTLNGNIPSRKLASYVRETAGSGQIPLQFGASGGILTDSSYVQLEGEGIPVADIGFPVRYSHSPVETCDAGDLEQCARLLYGLAAQAAPGRKLDRSES